jgi:hypothetical protein
MERTESITLNSICDICIFQEKKGKENWVLGVPGGIHRHIAEREWPEIYDWVFEIPWMIRMTW